MQHKGTQNAMAVFILTIVTSIFIAGALWLIIGSRLQLSADQQQNELLNVCAYAVAAVPVSFVIIFFGIGG